jgi:hypothetical protein
MEGESETNKRLRNENNKKNNQSAYDPRFCNYKNAGPISNRFNHIYRALTTFKACPQQVNVSAWFTKFSLGVTESKDS